MSPFTRAFWTDGIGSFVLAIGLALTVRWVFFEAYVIPSSSMLPTLLVNDHIFVNKILFGIRAPFSQKWFLQWRQPERGEVVVFKAPTEIDKYFIKRVVGTPGDQVLVENGYLYLNGKLVERTIPQSHKDDWLWLSDQDFPGDAMAGGRALYVHWEEHLAQKTHSILLRKEGAQVATFGPIKVPEGQFFVMGDNRDNSFDSRSWDSQHRFVPKEFLIGRASWVWLSCDSTLPVLTFLCNPLSIRWKRFFHQVE